jgi:hypothetical protein
VHWLEAALGTTFLAADVYFISDLPAELRDGRPAAHLRHGAGAGRAVHDLSGLARGAQPARGGLEA